jgi:threonine/homoserine/homoserine lactone efflux protein
MPTGTEWLFFLGGTAVFALLPGPGMLHVLARGLRGGRTEGLRSVVGTALGSVVQVAAVSLLLSAVLVASAEAVTAVRIVGVAYLVLLGLHALFGRSRGVVPASRRGVLTQGVVSEVVRPRTALFLLAFLPYFVPEGAGGGPLVFVLPGLLVVAVVLAVHVTVACCAAGLGAALAEDSRRASRQAAESGLVMVGAGTRVGGRRADLTDPSLVRAEATRT